MRWAQNLGLACSPAQHQALALPAEPLADAAASDGPRSLWEDDGIRMLQCPGMMLFHRAAKDFATSSKSTNQQDLPGDVRDIISPTIHNF